MFKRAVLLFSMTMLMVGCDVGPTSQGSAANPVNIGNVPVSNYSGSVGPVGMSYYVVNGVTPNTDHTITISGLSGAANIIAYDDNTWNIGSSLCGNTTLAGGTMDCTATFAGGSQPTGTSIYFTIQDGSGSGQEYNISVTSP